MSFLKVENLKKIYQQSKTIQVPAVNGVNLEVNQGEFMVISGPSGSGKTTLLNIIGGLDVPTAGKVFLEDKEITSLAEKELSKIRLYDIGFIFQAYNLIPVLSARENIEFVMMLQGIPEKTRLEKTEHIAGHLQIEELLDKKPNEMSGGQQQRVAIARSIASGPKLVLADEPTANLDSKTAEALIDMMQVLNKEDNITFIFSTHDKMVIEKARRRVVLRDGQIVSDD